MIQAIENLEAQQQDARQKGIQALRDLVIRTVDEGSVSETEIEASLAAAGSPLSDFKLFVELYQSRKQRKSEFESRDLKAEVESAHRAVLDSQQEISDLQQQIAALSDSLLDIKVQVARQRTKLAEATRAARTEPRDYATYMARTAGSGSDIFDPQNFAI